MEKKKKAESKKEEESEVSSGRERVIFGKWNEGKQGWSEEEEGREGELKGSGLWKVSECVEGGRGE